LLYLAVVKTHRCPCTAHSSHHQQGFVPQAQLTYPGLDGLLGCPQKTKFLEAPYAQSEQGLNHPIIQPEVVTQLFKDFLGVPFSSGTLSVSMTPLCLLPAGIPSLD
jgi:hypothetical protein